MYKHIMIVLLVVIVLLGMTSVVAAQEDEEPEEPVMMGETSLVAPGEAVQTDLQKAAAWVAVFLTLLFSSAGTIAAAVENLWKPFIDNVMKSFGADLENKDSRTKKARTVLVILAALGAASFEVYSLEVNLLAGIPFDMVTIDPPLYALRILNIALIGGMSFASHRVWDALFYWSKKFSSVADALAPPKPTS